MNRYPLWKNLLVFGILIVSTIVALPNAFPIDPSLQISTTDGTAVDEATLAQIRSALTEGGVTFLSAEIEENSALVRLEATDAQEGAQARLTEALPNHVIALALAPRTPGWLDALGLEPMLLGLDLRGGVHFLYQVSLGEAVQQYLETYESGLRAQFRERDIRFGDIRVEDSALRVPIIEPADMDRAEQIIRALDQGDQLIQLGQLTSRLIIDRMQVDGQSGFSVRLTDAAIRERQDFAIAQNTLTMRNRINALGVAEAVVQRQGLDRILVELPGIQDPARAKEILSSTATLEFRLVDHNNDAYEAERRGRAPLGSELFHRKDGTPILLRRDVIASGDQLLDAVSTYRQGQPAVNIRLDSVGGREMLDATIGNVGRNIAVVFIEDIPQMVERNGVREPGPPKREETVISDATIQSVLSSSFDVTGLSVFEARDLALLLRAGSLAAPISPVEEGTIGPSLGQENIDRGVEAVIIGYLLVVIFIGLWYRLFGMLANVALMFNVVMIVALMSLIPGAALTLPGIAGIVLTVGMSVDANVLIFERIREELGNGNTPQASIRAGWDKAFVTILDSNITTLIAAIVLFMFGTGPIKGFAVTLSIGIFTSLFTAIVVTRALVNLVYGNRPHVKTLSIGGHQLAAAPAPA
ncbi:MAG TPA: protein translocase subunit SecD [Gammaproteobacteria bacterium]|nr:protein translocase subunit SecD [Gammaproteobacteria bacterium]